MPSENLTAVLYGKNDLRLENKILEEPREDEVLLQMACVGICGSDVHYFVNGKIGSFVVNKPMVIGHESSGIVTQVGKSVEKLKIGDKVAVEPGVPCRKCDFCKKGKYNVCADIRFCATPPVDGSLRQYYAHAADFCYKLPENVTLEEGALAEPLAVGVRACKKAMVNIDSRVLILGVGPVGLLALVAAKAMGAHKVIVADIKQINLNKASDLGADAAYLIHDPFEEDLNAEKIEKLLKPNITIDASGAESSIRLAIKVTQRSGLVVLVGMSSREVKIPLTTALTKDLDIRCVFRYANDYLDALNIMTKKQYHVESIITHRFKIQESVAAFEEAKKNKSDAIKIMIYCN